MKTMLLAVMFTAAPAVAQEFAADMPAITGILAQTHALRTASSRLPAATAPEAISLRAKLLNDVEKLKEGS